MASISSVTWHCKQNLGVFANDLLIIIEALNRDIEDCTQIGDFVILDRDGDPKFPNNGRYKRMHYCIAKVKAVLLGEFSVYVAAQCKIEGFQFQKEKKVYTLLRGTQAITQPLLIQDKGGYGYIISELFNRGDLATFIGTAGFIPTAFSTHLIAYQIVTALNECHLRGIILRDLKIGNILVKETGNDSFKISLIDFGMAFIKGEDSQSESTRVCGTHIYLSDEERDYLAQTGELFPADESRDMWALGKVLHLLTTKMFSPEITPIHGIFYREIKNLLYTRREDRPTAASIQKTMYGVLVQTYPDSLEVLNLLPERASSPTITKWAEERSKANNSPTLAIVPEVRLKPKEGFSKLTCCFSF